MALLSLIFGEKKKTQIGLMQFDASLRETHSKEAEITDHPVEEGADVSDHIRKRPDSVEINGIVTDTPLVFLPSIFAPSPIVDDLEKGMTDRSGLAYWYLSEAMDNGELMTVVTTLREYENMAISSFGVTRDAANGNVMNATIGLREVLIAKTETVEAPQPKEVSQKKTVAQGKVSPSPANPAQAAKSQSGLRSIGQTVGLIPGGG